jgi:hypothetical protein
VKSFDAVDAVDALTEDCSTTGFSGLSLRSTALDDFFKDCKTFSAKS